MAGIDRRSDCKLSPAFERLQTSEILKKRRVEVLKSSTSTHSRVKISLLTTGMNNTQVSSSHVAMTNLVMSPRTENGGKIGKNMY